MSEVDEVKPAANELKRGGTMKTTDFLISGLMACGAIFCFAVFVSLPRGGDQVAQPAQPQVIIIVIR